jgi:hypothetical protein
MLLPVHRVPAGPAGLTKAPIWTGERSCGKPDAKDWRPRTRFLRNALVRTPPACRQIWFAYLDSTAKLASGGSTLSRKSSVLPAFLHVEDRRCQQNRRDRHGKRGPSKRERKSRSSPVTGRHVHDLTPSSGLRGKRCREAEKGEVIDAGTSRHRSRGSRH